MPADNSSLVSSSMPVCARAGLPGPARTAAAFGAMARIAGRYEPKATGAEGKPGGASKKSQLSSTRMLVDLAARRLRGFHGRAQRAARHGSQRQLGLGEVRHDVRRAAARRRTRFQVSAPRRGSEAPSAARTAAIQSMRAREREHRRARESRRGRSCPRRSGGPGRKPFCPVATTQAVGSPTMIAQQAEKEDAKATLAAAPAASVSSPDTPAQAKSRRPESRRSSMAPSWAAIWPFASQEPRPTTPRSVTRTGRSGGTTSRWRAEEYTLIAPEGEDVGTSCSQREDAQGKAPRRRSWASRRGRAAVSQPAGVYVAQSSAKKRRALRSTD